MRRVLPARFMAALRADATERFELPREVSHEARNRVRVAASIGTLAYAVFLLFELTGLAGGSPLERRIDVVHDVVGLALCLSLLAVAAFGSFTDRVVLSAALAVEVLVSAAISVHAPWAAFVRTGHLPSLTWVVPIVILFPLLVPAAPAVVLRISALCALTVPAGLWLLASRSAIEARPSDYWAGSLTAAVAVGISAIASRTVYGARRQAAALRMVGSYELLEPLGQGGMGEVWKARHLFLARPAAVKLILPARLQGRAEEREVALERFTREARVTASLRSPHTVELFDFGASTDGTLYYAMELLEGMNAEHFVYRFGPLDPRRVVSWLVQACHSLGEAHERNLVHRDIKPANLYVCRYGRDVDFVKVLDFGLTKPVEAPVEPSLTAPGFRMGTPSYMAPEQVFGLDAEPRTDLYALGCVGYWLLAGVKPFEADSAAELLRQHAQTAAPPLSGRAPRPVPPRLEALIMSCLAKDPADRPADADRMGLALEQSMDDEPWTAADARDWWVRNL